MFHLHLFIAVCVSGAEETPRGRCIPLSADMFIATLYWQPLQAGLKLLTMES